MNPAAIAPPLRESEGNVTSTETVVSNPHEIEIDESRLGERPPGVSEEQWRAKLVYEAHQAERAAGAEPITATSTTARDAARVVYEV